MNFIRNSGQYHEKVAFVCPLELGSRAYANYRGAGPYWVMIGKSGDVIDLIESPDDEVDFEASELGTVDGVRGAKSGDFPLEIGVAGSAYELVVMHGTATAALLTALGVK